MGEDQTPTRKGSPAIKIRVLPEGKGTIEALAQSVGQRGLSLASASHSNDGEPSTI
jgi:hypothetical protein